MRSDYPEYREWSLPLVRLLQGVIEQEDGKAWDVLMSNISQVEQFVARLGLQLVTDETEGLAYLRQFSEEETPAGYDALPKLFRASRLSFGQTVLAVVLRDLLRRFDEEETRDARCVVDEATLLDTWKAFFPNQFDEVKLQKDLQATLRKLEELSFVRRFGKDSASWEVRRILKARLTADSLEHLRDQLANAVQRKSDAEVSTGDSQ
ncbi:DUF4194 domain-containing protein [Blastopirellula marina]|uniref:DUF4194 domain-containing protein n=1 Tax=Blastopirellula marina DSM 3645 TaxID=314230 RepID=A3ZZ20_9BACT|nr:DUF4194 domain-containing protein [Blastopirellula marina]EAQ78158.1 hypothetical protein DSM3645_15315 [Blastopirellula marina DSM 3645]